MEIGLFWQENYQKWSKDGPQKGQFAIFSLVPLLLGPRNWSLGLKFIIAQAGTFINVSYIVQPQPALPGHLDQQSALPGYSQPTLPGHAIPIHNQLHHPQVTMPAQAQFAHPNPAMHIPVQTQQFVPPSPGVPHYEVLRHLEAESRRQAEASKQLSAYLASIMANQALSSSREGGIHSYQPQNYVIQYSPS